ncbi:MAG: hypothetical protein ABI432_10460 [Flavobacteriales bacterium]
MILRNFLISVLLLAASLVYAQPPVAGPNQTDAQGRKQGAWAKNWESGKLRYEGQFKDDRPIGTFKHYDEEGVLTTVQQHTGDGHVSRAQHFHPNGTLMAAGKYVDQQKDSTWSYYDDAGGLRKVERFKLGKLHGEVVSYYPGGQVAEKDIFQDGQLNGASLSWFPNGLAKSEATYVGGESQGKMVFYFPSGKKEIEGQMVNGDRDGTWYYFNEDGTIQLQVLYARGVTVKEHKENGTFTEYYDDDQVKSEVTYKKGKREGPFAEYHDDGTWTMRELPADPIKGTPADMERVLLGQTKRIEGTYKNDLLEGDVKEYDEKGKLVKTKRYVGGVAE